MTKANSSIAVLRAALTLIPRDSNAGNSEPPDSAPIAARVKARAVGPTNSDWLRLKTLWNRSGSQKVKNHQNMSVIALAKAMAQVLRSESASL